MALGGSIIEAKRNIHVLAIYGFLRGVGSSIFNTLFPLYLVYLGYQLSNIGELATTANLLIIFIIPFLGILSDTYGRKPFIILTGAAMSIGLLIVGLTPQYIFLLMAYTLMRFSFRGGQPVRGALLAESVSHEMLGAAVGLVTSMFFLARVFAPSLAGYLADTTGYKTTFLLGALIVFIGVSTFTIYGVETHSKKKDKISISRILSDLKPRRNFTWLYISSLTDRIGWSLWFPLLNAYIGKGFGLTATQVGLLNSLMFSVNMFTQYLFGRWIDRVGYMKGLIASETAAAMAAASLSITGNINFLVSGMMLSGLSVSLWIPSYNKAVSLNSEEDYRAVEFSKLNMFRSLAAVPAPYIGGYLYDYIDPRLPFTLSCVMFILTTIIFYIVWRKRSVIKLIDTVRIS